MKNNIIVVFSSHLSDEENAKFSVHIHETIGCKHQVVCYPNFNQYSLPEIYNKAIAEHNTDDAIMVFCHNDLTVKTRNWGKLLLTKFNNSNFQIIGVAGTTFLADNGVWWTDATKMHGVVEHTDGFKSWVNEYSKPIVGHITPVVLVDGLFMAVDCSNIEHHFDEEFKGFHLYDLSFCVPNYLDGCNIGVTTDIRIFHQSMGMTNDQWEVNRKQFVEKYKDELPLALPPPFKDIKVKLKSEPKVSVIIPTKNNFDILAQNIYSWKAVVNYSNYEILIADTGSSDDVIEQYNELLDDQVKLIRYDYYNFAKINNDMVRHHVPDDTELVLFCNDDVSLLNDALTRCVEIYNTNKNVGTIGIRLHYGDGSIQHNGIIMFFDQNKKIIFSHRDIRKTENYAVDVNMNSLGNTGAFLLIKKDVFLSFNGFSEEYVECFEDVELNIRCRMSGLKNITVSDAVAYHYESMSRNKLSGGNERQMTDYLRLLKFMDESTRPLNDKVQTTSRDMNPIINILTRTHNRPKHFNVCKESILSQSYKNVNHIVGSDTKCDYYDNYIKLTLQEGATLKPDGLASYPAPWNLHLNELQKYVKEGWVMYLDDDDKFVNSSSLSIIVNSIENENQMLLWRVDIDGNIVPNNQMYGNIVAGNISGIGFMFHTKHLPVDWGSWNFGDYRVISGLAKKLQQKWINMVLTQTQGRPNFGQTPID